MTDMTEISSWVRDEMPAMEKRHEELKTRLEVAKGRHAEVMARVEAMIDKLNKDMFDLNDSMK